MSSSVSAGIRLEKTVDSIRLGATVVGTLALFVPPAIALLVQWDKAAPVDIAIVAIPLAAVGVAWILFRGSTRAWVSVLAGFTMLTAEMLATSPNGPTWPPIASATFALSVIAIGGLPIRVAVGTIGLSALLCYAGVAHFNSHLLLISTDLLGGWITPLVDVALGASFLTAIHAWRRVARDFDRSVEEIHAEVQQALLEEEVDHARRAVDRRLHETVLNTLMVLRESPDTQASQHQARRDLQAIDSIESETSLFLPQLVTDAISAVPALEVTSTVNTHTSLGSRRSAAIFRDALVELLRNVDRHSGTKKASVAVRMKDERIHLVVTDRGVGMPTPSRVRFGSRETVRRSIESIGGLVEWSSHEGSGVVVTVEIPISEPPSPAAIRSSLDVLLGPRIIRVALNPTLGVGLLAIPASIAAFARPSLILLLFIGQLLATVLLIVRNHGWTASIARTAVIAFAVAVMFAAASRDPSCSSAVEMHWIIFASAGGVVLATLSFTSWAVRFGLLMAVIGVSVWVSVQYPLACLLDPLDAAVENAVWLVVIIAVVGGLSSVADRAREQAEVNLAHARSVRALNAAAQAAASRWRSLSPTTRSLLEDVANGSTTVGSDHVRAIASQEYAHVRSMIEIGRLESEPLRVFWEEVLRGSQDAGVHLTIHVNSPSGPQRVSELLRRTLMDLLYVNGIHAIDVTILDDSYLLSVKSATTIRLPDPWRLLHMDDEGQRVFEWPKGADGEASRSTRRDP